MRLSTRLSAAMVVLVMTAVGVVGLLTYRSVERALLPGEFDRIETHVKRLAVQLQAYVRSARSDAIAFQSAVALRSYVTALAAGGVDPQSNLPASEWRTRFAARLMAELAAKPAYMSMRVIGIADHGRELIRVDHSGPDGAIRDVPASELPQQGSRNFFRRAVELRPGEVFVSPVNRAQDNAVTGEPNVPVIRVATPIRTADGNLYAVFAITVDLRGAFADLLAEAIDGRQVYVVNEHGDYLLHPDARRAFAFEQGQPVRWQSEFAELAKSLGDAPSGAFLTRDAAGNVLGAAVVSAQLANGPRISIIETVPHASLMAPAVSVGQTSLMTGIAAVLAALVIAWLLARSITAPLTQITQAVEDFGHGKPFNLPTHAKGEAGTLARAFERMAAEVQEKTAALEREIAERKRLFETSLDLILVTDRQGTLLRVSPASKAILGRDPEEMVGRSATEFIYGEDLDPTRAEMRAARQGRQMRQFDCRYMHKDGHTVTLAWTGVWAEDEERHFFIGRDMSERVKLQQQLQQAQKMEAIGQLTGGIAHDFNNILTVITGTVETLADKAVDDAYVTELTQLIDDAATRGAELTRHLLAFARRQPLQPSQIDVNQFARDTERLLRPTLGEQIEIELMLEEGLWRAMADPNQLTTALLNLALNARDAMPAGGKLTIETRNITLDETYAGLHNEVSPGDYTMIAVSDTGVGIPAALAEKVFEPFFTTKTPGKGTGLGLSMVYGFVKQSGGHIKIYSEEGQGTSVKIYLPRAGAGSASVSQGSAAAVAKGGSESILIVEDDALVRRNVVAQIGSLGYRATAVTNAVEALAALESGAHFDLLFTDVVMPGGINGRELANEVNKRWPAVGVLFTSGYTENAIVHHGRLDAGVLLLTKPYRRAELARLIRLALLQRTNTAA